MSINLSKDDDMLVRRPLSQDQLHWSKSELTEKRSTFCFKMLP